jgi:hypothetical protein
MTNENKLSKNIRPLTLLVIIVIYTAFACLDGNLGSFNIADAYVKLLGEWGMLIMSFYFGGRSAEKIFEKLNQNKKENGTN